MTKKLTRRHEMLLEPNEPRLAFRIAKVLDLPKTAGGRRKGGHSISQVLRYCLHDVARRLNLENGQGVANGK